jgi:FkbM family methyltransferase
MDRVSRYVRQTKKRLGIPVEHAYGEFSITLPADHMLPVYQKQHRRYDRFLPRLAKYIDHGATIIDVGANCGDSLAAMVEQNAKSTYVCIEPDAVFFEYLALNIRRIKAAVPGVDVRAIKSLVGKNITLVALEGVGGTKHAVAGQGNHQAETLDEIVRALIGTSRVSLIKSDVDGFDYDVIDSAEELIASNGPMIFFECYVTSLQQKEGFESTLNWLQSIGYKDWTAFDNFGEVILRTADAADILQLIDYVWKQSSGGASRTIYYLDFLAGMGSDRQLIDAAVRSY